MAHNVSITQLEFHDDRMLVKRAEEQKSAGGIIIPGTGDEKPNFGTIIILGVPDEGKRCPYKKGDEILFGKYAGIEVDLLDEHGILKEYVVMRMTDAICTIHPAKKK